MKPPRDAQPLRLGPDVISQIIPHRRPLVMVDAVVAYRHAPAPTLWARRQISANEDIFTGHFPGYHLWPGVYTIEGLGQSTLICAIIALLVREREQRPHGDGGPITPVIVPRATGSPSTWASTSNRASGSTRWVSVTT